MNGTPDIMLQCSKYKARPSKPGATIGLCPPAEFHATFTKSPSFAAHPGDAQVICGMDSFTGARNVRNLVAAKRRHLADDTLCQGDRSLYLMAAEALDKRASVRSRTADSPAASEPDFQAADA
jgi:hypothetical protein